jgi:hypothetical protein
MPTKMCRWLRLSVSCIARISPREAYLFNKYSTPTLLFLSAARRRAILCYGFKKVIWFTADLYFSTRKIDFIQYWYFLYRNYTRIIFLINMIFVNANFSQTILVWLHSTYRRQFWRQWKIKKVLKVLMKIERSIFRKMCT